MDHIVLNVVDIEKMLQFYTEILQLTGERLDAFRTGSVPFPSVRISKDTIIDLFPRKMWQGSVPADVCRPNLNHFCLATDQATWEQLHVRLLERGITIDDGPVRRWGAHGTGISLYFRDPEENIIEIRYYETPTMDRSCLLGS
jgi:catechol 2,3-dioxygenase-like lactoylglutathione lyase family enzyme